MILSLIFLAALQTSPPMQPLEGQATPITAHTTAPATAPKPDQPPATPVSNAERSSITITSADLDLHLTPTEGRLEGHATLKVQNASATPLVRIPLQLSSTLHWNTFSIATANGLKAIPFTQSPIATDADHTGYAQEAVLTPAEPLAPGATLTVSTFYTGEIPQTAARLDLIGVPTGQAAATDWDQISPENTALRGFGNVLWYPVAAPTALLGDTNRLFQIIGQNRLQQAGSLFRLRFTVEYIGEAPSAAILNGQTQLFETTNDTQDSLVAETHGLATAEWPSAPLGFRSPNLFLTNSPATVTEGQLLAVVTPRPAAVEPLTAAAGLVRPLLVQWLGPTPLTPLTILDHAGQIFEDDALLVTPVDPNSRPEQLAPQLVHGLSHAWLRSSHPWIDEGLAQFMNLLWTERAEGREAAVAQLQQDANLIALAEPDLTAAPATASTATPAANSTAGPASPSTAALTAAGQPLTEASSEIYFRTKAAAVWWQLRSIAGDETLQQALQAYRHSEALNATFDRDPKSFERTLERLAKRDLGWFFEDWVYRDGGLPDLSIVGVSPRPLPVRPGKDPGFLVAVEVRNDGGAAAEVPVTVRSGTLIASKRLRILAHTSASTRIVFEGKPEEVQVNDGTTPELAGSLHIRQIKVQP